jgi:hypothetical protein
MYSASDLQASSRSFPFQQILLFATEKSISCNTYHRSGTRCTPSGGTAGSAYQTETTKTMITAFVSKNSARSAKVAGALLRAGADVNSRGLRNVTPLHLVWPHLRNVIELAEVLVDAGADLNACADFAPMASPLADGLAWTPLVWVQEDPPRMLCSYPFGPSRSVRASHDRRVAKYVAMVLLLQGHGDGMIGEAECEEKYATSIC